MKMRTIGPVISFVGARGDTSVPSSRPGGAFALSLSYDENVKIVLWEFPRKWVRTHQSRMVRDLSGRQKVFNDFTGWKRPTAYV